jgi:hypothetical protein
MTHDIACFRCGASLSRLSLPLTRQDLCPECGVELHVCKMCVHFDPAAPCQCREDDAEDVKEKELANFCEWYSPSETAFSAKQKSEADQALESLEAMFSDLGDTDQES